LTTSLDLKNTGKAHAAKREARKVGRTRRGASYGLPSFRGNSFRQLGDVGGDAPRLVAVS
jgi:hypothetical protein